MGLMKFSYISGGHKRKIKEKNCNGNGGLVVIYWCSVEKFRGWKVRRVS
jgi:hypothetical protein